MDSQCEQVRQEHQELESLFHEFVSTLNEATTGAETPEQALEAHERAKQLRAELERKSDALAEKLWLFEALPQKELQRQYEGQEAILLRNGILEQLSNRELGIRAIDGREYAFPSLQEIQRAMRVEKEVLKPKTEQGFNQLLIVPFGMKLDNLIEKFRQVILKHYREGKLFAAKEKPTDPDEPLGLNENEPVWVWKDYRNADVSGNLVYFPQSFTQQNHGGETKRELLAQQGGFNVLLIENLPNIPRTGQGKEINGRRQLEACQTPNQYLEILNTNPQYRSETGMTPEEQITYATRYLEETNQVIDDYQGKGSISWQLGAWFLASGHVPSARWIRDDARARLGWSDPEYSDSDVGGRGAVRIKIRT